MTNVGDGKTNTIDRMDLPEPASKIIFRMIHGAGIRKPTIVVMSSGWVATMAVMSPTCAFEEELLVPEDCPETLDELL